MSDKSLKEIVAEMSDEDDANKATKPKEILVATNEARETPSADAFIVEHGVPIPKVSINRARIYPFDKMGNGDSFKVPVTEDDSMSKAVARVRAAVTAWRSQGHKDQKYIVRAMSDHVRCWRKE